jgi:hypothetical protein
MDEDRFIYVLLIVITAPAVIAAIASRGQIGPGQTLACLLCLVGLVGLVRSRFPRRELIPRACTRKRR